MKKSIFGHRTDQEWFDLITECRQSGLSDSQWCRLNSIPSSTCSTAVKRLRNKSYALPDRACVDINPLDFTSKQEVVKVDIVNDRNPVRYDETSRDVEPALPSSMLLDNSHTIEIKLGNAIIRLSNDANPDLVKIVTCSIIGEDHYAC